MALPPDRFAYSAIIDRPKLTWPNDARVAFWVAPNIEHYEYTPLSRPNQPDIPSYARNDFANRVGFWRMMDVLNKYNVRGCACLNLGILDHFPEVKDAMIAADWDYMAHGVYNSRPIYGYSIEDERAYWADFIATVKKHTGKMVKGRLGGGGGHTENTDDLMAEAGCLYHTSWIVDDQPIPVKVKGGQKFLYVPYSGQTNDAIANGENRETDHFFERVIDQFDTLYEEGAESGRVMCLSLHPQMIGRPSAAKYLDAMLKYILGHGGVWLTTGDEIAEYYLANYYDTFMEHLAAQAPSLAA
jgi:peptidoglycan/xylan/chitin deacetylase (PgdA/CDA1 family)